MQCPNCRKEIAPDCYFETESREPFVVSSNPLESLRIWGPYGAEKTIFCKGIDFIHFKFGDGDLEERLVMLGRRSKR